MSTTYQDIEHKYNEFCKRYREIQVKQEYQAISEADLDKIERGSMNLLYDKLQTTVLLRDICGMPIVVESHVHQKSKTRYINDARLRKALYISDEPDYLHNIKEILETLFNNYKEFASDGINTCSLKEIVEDIFDVNLKGTKSHNDDIDDIPIKLSLYSFVKYEYELFMIESAVAAAISAFTYNHTPIDYIRRTNPSVWNGIKTLNSTYTDSHNGHVIIDVNAPKFGPVINVTSYATWVRKIDNLDDVTPVPTNKLSHWDGIEDIFSKKLPDESYVFSLPYNGDSSVHMIDKDTFGAMCTYEQKREKNKKEQ